MNSDDHAELPPDDASLCEALDALANAINSDPAQLDSVLRRYPQFAETFAKVAPAMFAMHDLSTSAEEPLNLGHIRGTLGDYEILSEIGRGGMGIVYEARQISLDRRVALKVLPVAFFLDDRRLVRFQNEARAVAALKHPHIVSVYAVGLCRGVHFYAMELIEGQPLTRVIAEHFSQPAATAADRFRTSVDASTRSASTSEHAVWIQRVVRLAIQAADALEHAHQRGIVHRDIKPSNLLLDKQGRLFIADFGLAQVGDDSSLTRTGDLVGTLRYMSPEQAYGEPIVDQRADVYSLGVTLYELLCGRPPFTAESRRELIHEISEQPPPGLRKLLPGIPVDLETIVLKAIAKESAERYQSAQAFADDLRRFGEQRPIAAKRSTLADRLTKLVRRRAFEASVVGLAMLLLLVVLAVAAIVATTAQQRAEQERIAADDGLQLSLRAVADMFDVIEQSIGEDTARVTAVAVDLCEGLRSEVELNLATTTQMASMYTRLALWAERSGVRTPRDLWSTARDFKKDVRERGTAEMVLSVVRANLRLVESDPFVDGIGWPGRDLSFVLQEVLKDLAHFGPRSALLNEIRVLQNRALYALACEYLKNGSLGETEQLAKEYHAPDPNEPLLFLQEGRDTLAEILYPHVARVRWADIHETGRVQEIKSESATPFLQETAAVVFFDCQAYFRRQGNVAEAEFWLTEAEAIIEDLRVKRPWALRFEIAAARGLIERGHLLDVSGRSHEALNRYRHAWQTLESIQYPRDRSPVAKVVAELADAHETVLRRYGRVEEATSVQEREGAFWRNSSPGDSEARELASAARINNRDGVAQKRDDRKVVQWRIADGGNGHYYELVRRGCVWDHARLDARQREHRGERGYLATLTSEDELAFVGEQFPGADNLWVGGYQEYGAKEPKGGWRWITDEPFVFELWSTQANGGSGAEPNDHEDREECLAVVGATFGTLRWNDADGTLPLPGYLVEYEPSDQ